MTNLILVTGATGFVGRHIVAELLRRGVPVRVVVRGEKKGLVPRDGGIESVIETPDLFLESESWFRRASNGVDTVIHAAWYTEPGKYLTSPVNVPCLVGTLALASGAVAERVRRFVGVGTCFEYDVSQCRLDIATPLKPTTPYAATKAATYLTLSQVLGQAGVGFAWCRLFYLHGDGEDERRLVPYVRQRIAKGELVHLTSGNQIRDYLPVTIAAARIVDIALGNTVGPHNICSGVPVTIRQFVERIADAAGGRHLLRFDARPDNLVDPPCIVGVP